MAPNTTAPHWSVRLNRVNRIASYLMLFAILGAHMRTQTPAYGPYAWALLGLQFMVYPHLAYWRACRARDTRQAELHNLTIDSLLFGIWAAALGFPVWITFTLFITTTINHALYRDPWAMTHSAARHCRRRPARSGRRWPASFPPPPIGRPLCCASSV